MEESTYHAILCFNNVVSVISCVIEIVNIKYLLIFSLHQMSIVQMFNNKDKRN